MREFNITGPCDPALHYTVPRDALIAKALKKIIEGRYFTLFAPRQAGKTTFLKRLLNHLDKENDFITILLSFENLKTVSKDDFYQELNHELKRELAKYQIQSEVSIRNPVNLRQVFEKRPNQSKQIVLVIDEFEGIPDAVLSEVMHTFRKIYHQKEYHGLQALILVGVSTVAELVVSEASPFNIAEELQMPYFSFEEVRVLIKQYVTESGQVFEEAVIKAIYENTKGQPGLVCALCAYLVEKLATVRRKPVTLEHYYKAQHHFLTERFDKNIINIVQKARQKRQLMLKLLFDDEPILFSIHDPDMAFLYANGVIDKDNGQTDIVVPLYKKALITAFRPLINGETRHYINSPDETINTYLTDDNDLNINALLNTYRAYIRRRGFRAFDTINLKEAAWHYSLDGFINFFIQRLGGQTYLEVPSGRGRTDILIRYQGRSNIIETKVYSDKTYFKRGKGQLATYLKSEGIAKGYYVVFSHQHTEQDQLFSEEMIQEKQIYTHIIPIKFEQPSRLPVPDELKLTASEQIACNLLKMETFTIEQIAQITAISTERLEQLSVQS
ncbi:MAG TPA: ATP-binding protein [Thiotrichaceae bacterium]|nr:ATP-binding protein [Thiotrichaceae bacterium]